MAVGIGAFGAHGLEDFLVGREIDPETIAKRTDQFDVGVRYHMFHVVALFALATIPYGSPTARWVTAALFVAGTILFSGSLYVLVLMNNPWLGRITPIGGVIWIVAWLSLIVIAQKRKTESWSSGETWSNDPK
ncbi:MAG: DUF423 domain-containing protein [Pirellulaceae bacterium]|nr:DUF423 domain-containing protein [Pirellulaceae bacterium]